MRTAQSVMPLPPGKTNVCLGAQERPVSSLGGVPKTPEIQHMQGLPPKGLRSVWQLRLMVLDGGPATSTSSSSNPQCQHLGLTPAAAVSSSVSSLLEVASDPFVG